MASAVLTRCVAAPRRTNVPAPKRGSLLKAQATYKVTLRTKNEGEVVLDVDENTYILDAADEAGLDLPYSCRAGGCSACCSRVVSGAPVDQREQNFLDDDQLASGFCMICVSYPTGDVVIQTQTEDQL